MKRPNWKIAIPLAVVAGLVLFGITGMLIGPLAVLLAFSWSRQRKRTDPGIDDEARRFAEFLSRAGAVPALATNDGTAAGDGPVARPARKPAFDEIRQRIDGLDSRAAFTVLAEARLALLENRRDAHAAVQAALAARRIAVSDSDARAHLRFAEHAIEICIPNGHAAMAAALFGGYVEEREALTLKPRTWELLGRTLLGQGLLREAAFALHTGAVISEEKLLAQKRLIEVAGKAGELGQAQLALELYQMLLQRYPDSQFADFVRSNILIEERRLARYSD